MLIVQFVLVQFLEFMKAEWLERFILEKGFNIDVKAYYDLFPSNVEIDVIQVLITKRYFPTLLSLMPSFLWCIFFCAFRYILERSFFADLATSCLNITIKNEPIEFKGISKVDKAELSKFKKPNISTKGENISNEANQKLLRDKNDYDQKLSAFAVSRGLELDVVKAYIGFNKRRIEDAKKITKFIEAFYRGLFYLIFTIIGYKVLFSCEGADIEDSFCSSNGRVHWIDNLSLNWERYPYHRLSDPIKLYYLIQLGCYFHQLMWCEVTSSRSDALEMILHHIATITLLSISYITNFTRIGSLILLTHDVADFFLEFAKCFNYIKQNNKAYSKPCGILCDILFGIFVVVFFVSRLIYYPFYILNSYFFTKGYCGYDFLGGKIFSFCLLLLQCLHVYWFALIVVMVKKLLSPKGIETDCRSDNGSAKEESIKSGDDVVDSRPIDRSVSNENLLFLAEKIASSEDKKNAKKAKKNIYS